MQPISSALSANISKATVRSRELLAKLEIEDLDLILREKVRWFGHVEHSTGAVRTSCDRQVGGRRMPGRPKMMWKKLTLKAPRKKCI